MDKIFILIAYEGNDWTRRALHALTTDTELELGRNLFHIPAPSGVHPKPKTSHGLRVSPSLFLFELFERSGICLAEGFDDVVAYARALGYNGPNL